MENWQKKKIEEWNKESRNEEADQAVSKSMFILAECLFEKYVTQSKLNLFIRSSCQSQNDW